MFIHRSELNYTPEELADQRCRLDRSYRRGGMKVFFAVTANGFTASRDGNTGHGRTENDAELDLEVIERRQLLDPTGQFKEILDQVFFSLERLKRYDYPPTNIV